ncbi:MAG: hybrid sensor histidine kinase/response regulator [Bacteroidota bacterium]|nr:hybrid sensor histidine kinase/response regulator [Bacteroidota bacterium]
MKTLNILVVDDEPGICTGIQRVLRNFSVSYPFYDDDFNYDVATTGTGEDALDIITKNTPDIILLDNKLPGMNGIEVLEYIKTHKIDTAVMMITSFASMDLAVNATNNGAYNFIPKPFTQQEIKTAVESITKHLFLKRMTRKMTDSSKEVRFKFLSVVSHEMKSPINAIEGYLRIMNDEQAGKEIADYKPMIDRSLERIKSMRTLIENLLDLTGIQSGKKKRHIESVDLCQRAKIAISSVEPMAEEMHIKIHLDSPESLFIKSDNSEIDIIFNNLLSNAVKYNKKNGEVFLSISQTENLAEIHVEDTGIGMSEEDIKRLFHDFTRIKNAQTKNISGTGLGLSILKEITELNNGLVRVDSEISKGSVFTVSLPLNT